MSQIAVKYQRIGLQRSFESFRATATVWLWSFGQDSFELKAVVHKPSSCTLRNTSIVELPDARRVPTMSCGCGNPPQRAVEP